MQFIKFAMVGGISTIIDWGAFFIFNHLGIHYLVAKTLSFILAVINSYIFNRSWTFQSESLNRTTEFIKFILVSVIGLSLNTLIFYINVNKFHLTYLYSLIIATALVLIWNYSANKWWTFRK